MIRKLHRFARLQQAKLIDEKGVIRDLFNKHIHKLMRTSVKVILKRHNTIKVDDIEGGRQSPAKAPIDDDEFFEQNLDTMIDKMNNEMEVRD